jgi:hypothetical protein
MPPWGISEVSMKWVLIQVQPYCRWLATLLARPRSRVQTELARP